LEEVIVGHAAQVNLKNEDHLVVGVRPAADYSSTLTTINWYAPAAACGILH